MKRYIFLVAAVALATVSCSKTYDTNLNASEGSPITLGTWADVMTRAPWTAFANGNAFDVYGFKWKDGPANQTNVFNGDDVTYDGSDWSYTTLRFWDSNFDNYTFFAAFPAGKLAAEAATNDYAQRGRFITNELTYNGTDEVLLVAQKKTVPNASFGAPVPLVFKHTGSLVDIKFKKHADITKAVVNVTSIKLSGIKTKGTYTVADYDGSNNPVGKTVSTVDGLGWTPDETPTVNAATAEAAGAPYVKTDGVSLAADAGVGTANAAALLSNLVVMPQVLATNEGPKITITYTITTGTGESAETITYADKEFFFGEFDRSDNTSQSDPRIANWKPGYHYTYYITINAKAIEFTASIDSWDSTLDPGHYYLAY